MPQIITHHVGDENDSASILNFLDEKSLPVYFKDIKIATTSDRSLQTVIRYVQHGWPRKINCASIQPFFRCKADFEIEDGVLLRGHRVVIPQSFRINLLSELHKGHFGIVKTKSIARGKMWWPGIDKDIERTVGACRMCSAQRAAPSQATPAPWPRPDAPWDRIHIDYMSIAQRTYLVVIDAFSKWLECLEMRAGTSSSALITQLKPLFSRFGIPKVIVSDNDVKIKTLEFAEFCRHAGIQHVTSPIYHPESNGQAENSVKCCKKMLKCILSQNTSVNSVNEKMLGFLFEYRNTPHCSTGSSPAQLMLGRKLRSRLDVLQPPHKSNSSLQMSAHTCRKFNVGEKVWVRWFIARKPSWVLGTVTEKLGNRLYLVHVQTHNVICKRHIDQILRYTGGAPKEADSSVSTTDSSVVGQTSFPNLNIFPPPAPEVIAPTVSSSAPSLDTSQSQPRPHPYNLRPRCVINYKE